MRIRPTLLFKFSTCYLLVLVISLIVLNTYGSDRIEERIEAKKMDALKQEASVISSEYMENYYRGTMTLSNLSAQLQTIDTFAEARIWIISKEGYILYDSQRNTSANRYHLSADFLEQDSYNEAQIKGILDNPSLCIIHPVNLNFELKGYIALLSDRSAVLDAASYYMDTLNSCFLLMSALYLIVMLYLYSISILPLRQAIITAREYADGHLDYKPKIRHGHDEFQDLSDTIEYMATELNQMEEYQHKFIANISHDFRSPLTSIKGFAEAMMDGTIPPELHNKYLSTICFETERLTKLTSGLLELNNFDNNTVRLDITTFDINHIIKHTAETFEGACRSKQLTLNLTFSDHQAFVEADMGRIQQVLYNLIDNAIKFSHHGSSIDVNTYEKGTKLFVSIKDYGIGISKENIKKIWDRFYKIDTSRGRDKKGTGLGLAIVKEIMNMHGEDINVISTKDVGTEFTFTLPRAASPEE